MVYEHTGRQQQQYGGSYGGQQSGSNIRDQANRRMREAREYVSEKSSRIKRQVEDTAHKAQDWFTDTVDEYPLAVGGACIVLGMAVGFALPTTKSERKYIGQTGRRVMHEAQEVGSRIIDQGEKIAERAVETVRSSVKSGHQSGGGNRGNQGQRNRGGQNQGSRSQG